MKPWPENCQISKLIIQVLAHIVRAKVYFQKRNQAKNWNIRIALRGWLSEGCYNHYTLNFIPTRSILPHSASWNSRTKTFFWLFDKYSDRSLSKIMNNSQKGYMASTDSCSFNSCTEFLKWFLHQFSINPHSNLGTKNMFLIFSNFASSSCEKRMDGQLSQFRFVDRSFLSFCIEILKQIII